MIIANDLSVTPTFVLIHGAGAGSKERIYTYAGRLAESGVSMFSFDQSGAGKDADNIKLSSLERRTQESIFSINNFCAKENLVVCGSSMGGEIAIRTLEHFSVKSLILFCPAIYTPEAFSVPFGGGFTDIIRKEDGWKNSVTLKLLESYTGKLLIVIGELDTVIPPGVIEALNRHSPLASEKEIYRIPGCPHRYQEWLNENPEELERVVQKVVQFSQ